MLHLAFRTPYLVKSWVDLSVANQNLVGPGSRESVIAPNITRLQRDEVPQPVNVKVGIESELLQIKEGES
jgi:hypothetical protein